MSIYSSLSRNIYKKISSYWSKIEIKKPYVINLIKFLSCSSQKISDNMSENIRIMKNSLKILIKKKIINNYFYIKKKKDY